MKAHHHPLIWVIALVLALIIFIYVSKIGLPIFPSLSKHKSQAALRIPVQGTYAAQKFDLSKKLNWLTTKQTDQHKALYEGYVNKRNEITEKLRTVDREEKGNRTYSPYRSLKIAETFAVNGSLLHELYFENLGGTAQEIGKNMHQLILDNFGSVENFKKDLLLAASCAQGWVVTSWGIDDQRLHNYVLEAHNQNVPVLAIPLLVLDVYEHAYMIDFGINRDPYLNNFWETIDWNVVEERILKWVHPLSKK